jgi:hypothetical protein
MEAVLTLKHSELVVDGEVDPTYLLDQASAELGLSNFVACGFIKPTKLAGDDAANPAKPRPQDNPYTVFCERWHKNTLAGKAQSEYNLSGTCGGYVCRP